MLNELVEAMQAKSYKGSEYSVKRFYQATAAAYFSIEVALNKSLPALSGGLGILAGDSMLSVANLQLLLNGVTVG